MGTSPANTISLIGEMSAAEFRAAATAAKDANQARRLLALAAIRDGLSRADAARIGGMDRQTLRDWVHAYNTSGIAGLINRKAPGPAPKLSAAQKAEIKELVLKGPDPEADGVVRWRRIDLVRFAEKKFKVKVDADTMGRVLRELGFSHISARPRYPAQPEDAVISFQKRSMRN
jgi:transposase